MRKYSRGAKIIDINRQWLHVPKEDIKLITTVASVRQAYAKGEEPDARITELLIEYVENLGLKIAHLQMFL